MDPVGRQGSSGRVARTARTRQPDAPHRGAQTPEAPPPAGRKPLLHRRVVQAALVVTVIAVVLGGTAGTVLAVHAFGIGAVPTPGNQLEIDPQTSSVSLGETFTVRITQSTLVATSGTQATLRFDPSVLQIEAVDWGTAYRNAVLSIPTDFRSVIAQANKNGVLKQVAQALGAPNLTPAGNVDFLLVEFKATSCGRSSLDLPVGSLDGAMIDGRTGSYGNPIQLGSIGGLVVVAC